MKFKLEKHIPDSDGIPGGWYYEGTYSPASIDRLCTCCFLFGGAASAYDNIRVTVIEDTVVEDDGPAKTGNDPESEGANV